MANQLIQLFQILARSGIRFWKARPGLLSLLVQILAADFWNQILLGSPFGSDSAARQRNPSIKAEPNRAILPHLVKLLSKYQILKTFNTVLPQFYILFVYGR